MVNMSPAPKTELKIDHWQPTASKVNLQARAKIIQAIRQFFIDRKVLEVETPALAQHTVSDPYLDSIQCDATGEQATLYLQTSPEYHMKRLLCADSGSIFQMCKSFRVDEQGRLHNPEFTMLEWYRVGFDHHQLMDEMDDLLQLVLQCNHADRMTYQQVFQKFLNIDPLHTNSAELKHCAENNGVNDPGLGEVIDDWLMLLFSYCIEPHLQRLTFVYDYPASQSALSRVNEADPRVSDRFEVYYQGIELANGFYELANAKEQRQRFIDNNKARLANGKQAVALDEMLLSALEHGLPKCAGVALGIDRLVMLALNSNSINEVIAFNFSKA